MDKHELKPRELKPSVYLCLFVFIHDLLRIYGLAVLKSNKLELKPIMNLIS